MRLKTQLLSIRDSLKTAARENGEFEIINQVFVEKTAKVKDSYLGFLKQNYNAGIAKIDFKSSEEASEDSRKVINKYVSALTKEKITNLLPENSIKRDTRSVFLNAIYMKLNWDQQFDTNLTKTEEFIFVRHQFVESVCLVNISCAVSGSQELHNSVWCGTSEQQLKQRVVLKIHWV